MATVSHQRRIAAGRRLRAIAVRVGWGEPHLARGPFTRWPRLADAVLAVTVFAVTVIAVALSGVDDGETFSVGSIGELPAGAFALLAVGAAALWWRRAHPGAVAASVIAVTLVWAVAGYGDGQDLALAVATYNVGRYGADEARSLLAVVAASSASVVGSIVDASQRVDVWPAVLLTALPWYVGRRVRNRGEYLALLRERAERLEADQHARAREAVAVERSRIARELHDVVAHQVSMMTVQAGAAKTIAPDDLDTAIAAMGDVERAGRDALGELRHLLGVLRRDGDEPDLLGPQRRIVDIPALVDQLASTGAAVTFELGELPDRCGTAVELSAYRIVQEACTNIVKHAGPNPAVEITIAPTAEAVVIDVCNTMSAPAGFPRSGYGIAGMRERASLLGGTLTVADGPHRFRVTAHLPFEAEPA